MGYSQTTSIFCASLAGLILLIVIIVRIRQSIIQRRATPPAAAAPVEPAGQQVGIPVIAPAAVQVPVSQPVQAPRPLPVEMPASPEPEPAEDEDDQPVTSQEIVALLKELSPVQAEAAKENFKGSAVEWTLFYSSMMLKGSNQIEVTLLNADNAYPGVSFLVGMNEYPELKGIKWGTPVTVRGEISAVYSMYIVLTDVKLSFPGPA
jgi:hypothetical protein